MRLEELLALDLSGKKVLIIGPSGAGKTHIAKLLDPKDTHTVHTDDFLTWDKDKIIAAILLGPLFSKNKTIVEGNLGYKLLLEGQLTKEYIPEIIIDIQVSSAKQAEIYRKERDARKLRWLKHYHMNNLALYNEWFRITDPETRPTIYELQNDY